MINQPAARQTEGKEAEEVNTEAEEPRHLIAEMRKAGTLFTKIARTIRGGS